MQKLTRKEFLRRLTAGCAVNALPLRYVAADTAAKTSEPPPLMIPYPAKPWAQVVQIVGDRPQLRVEDIKGKLPSFDRLPLYNDFCLIEGIDGRWHAIGCYFEGHSAADLRQDRLFHYVGDSIQGPYQSVGYVDLGYGSRYGVWSPCIVRDGNRALIYFGCVDEKKGMSLRVAESIEPQLGQWRRGAGGREILFSEPGDRDPEIIKDERTGLYLMYYIADENDLDVVRVRTSRDLITWGDPRRVLAGTPRGYQGSESVFVLQENGYYYLWISDSAQYSRMSLYISTDPYSFGDANRNRIEEQPGHAPEIVRANGHYWMACVAIATVADLPYNNEDLPIVQHDLEGVWIQPLEWRPATEAMEAKVVRG